MEYTVHPAAEVFPMLEGKDYLELRASIEAQGQLNPVLVQRGMILDGRNRKRACEDIGIGVIYEEVETDDPIAFVVAQNLTRRHMSTDQRAAIAAELANMKSGTRTDLGSNDPRSEISIKQAAEMMNVGEATVKRAKKRMVEDREAHEAAKRGEKPKKSKPKAKRVSWRSVAQAHGILTASPSATQTRKAKAKILAEDSSIEFNAGGTLPEMAFRIADACQKISLRENTESELADAQAVAESAKKSIEKGAAERLDAAIRAHKRVLDVEYEIRIQERVKVELQIMLDDYNRVSDKHKAVIAAYKGVFTRSEYKSLLSVLHSDRYQNLDDVQRAKLEKGFNLVKSKEFELCGDDGSVEGVTLPKTVSELMAMRKNKY